MDTDRLIQSMKMMRANANKTHVNPIVLHQHTNKLFLIENHKTGMDYVERILTSEGNLFQHTVTPNIKFSSDVTLDAKNLIQIKDLFTSINKPIDGKFLLCRTICPPCKMTALMTIVDDPEGKLATKILLYNFVPTASQLSRKDAYPYLPVGTMLAIMNPWFKTTAEGGVAVRCDNPKHVVRMDPSQHDRILGGLTWKGQIPKEFQKNEPAARKLTASDWKKMGNNHFASKRFQESVIAYTNGIDSESNKSTLRLDLLSNRSAAHLKLCNYSLALADAQSVLDANKAHMKCIIRKANALLGMGRYEDALTFLTSLSLDISSENRKIINELIAKGERFTAQSRTGDYPWKEIFSNESPDYCHDIAEYKSSVTVKESPNKGRGLFATETIKAGQLILASRAFANVAIKDRDVVYINSKSTNYANTRSQTELVTKIAQILKDCPEKCAEFYSLYGGVEYSNSAKSSQDFGVDLKRIDEICHYNSFGSGGLVVGSENDVSGIWIIPSFMNHSCVDDNSSWIRNGNFIFVRAFHEIAQGQEILISYLPPFESMIQKKLEKYGFVCDCRLCKRDRLDSLKVQNLRSDLASRLSKILVKIEEEKTEFDHRDIVEVSTIINLLNESRTDAPELNIFFLDHVNTIALLYYRQGLHLKCASTLENIYNATKGIASLCDFTMSAVANIIKAYLAAGDKKTATIWFEIFKRGSALQYGSSYAVEARFVKTLALLKKAGLLKGQ